MKMTAIGIESAKAVFQVYGVERQGKTVLRKQLKREQMAVFFATLSSCMIRMEACGVAASLGSLAARIGSFPKSCGAAFVKPYVKLNRSYVATRRRFAKP